MSTAGRGRPARLDRASTVDAALELLDDVGLEALTMRRLADRLGVRAGALYRHFTTKQDLLTAMAERMLQPLAQPPSRPAGDADWAARLTAPAHALRRALLARRDGARVFGGTHTTGPHTVAFAETALGALHEAGLGDEDAARAFMTLVNYVLGHTLEEQAAVSDGIGGTEAVGRLRDAATAGEHPRLAAAFPVLTSADFDTHFDFGLRVLIEGLRHL